LNKPIKRLKLKIKAAVYNYQQLSKKLSSYQNISNIVTASASARGIGTFLIFRYSALSNRCMLYLYLASKKSPLFVVFEFKIAKFGITK
jgi:hypothetical protein